MTLREKIEEMNPETIVKIGAKDGSGWIYAGKASGFKSDKYDQKIIRDAKALANGALNALERMALNFPRSEEDAKKKGLKWGRFSDDLAAWGLNFANKTRNAARVQRVAEDIKPLNDREVVEVWDADGEDAINILVEGGGMGKYFQAHHIEKLEDINADGVAALAIAIYKPHMESLKEVYYKKLKAKKNGTKLPETMAAREKILTEWLKKDMYGLSTEGGKGLVKVCKDAAEAKMKEEEKAQKEMEAQNGKR